MGHSAGEKARGMIGCGGAAGFAFWLEQEILGERAGKGDGARVGAWR